LISPSISTSAPPKEIPADLYNEFTWDDLIPVIYIYFNDYYPSDRPLIYTYEQIQTNIARAQARETNHYGITDTYLYQALDAHISAISGKNVAVMGSVVPWYESILLAYGAHPTTIEYNKIISKHPGLEVLTVAEFEAAPRLFDAVLSVSSFEHDGLGRYGDPINPNGDLIAMEKTKKMLKPGGLLFLAIPIGRDRLVWNAHRIYGHLRLAALLQGWEVVGTYGFTPADLEADQLWGSHQPTFVLRPVK
jgi:hypothetical protein